MLTEGDLDALALTLEHILCQVTVMLIVVTVE